MLEIIKKKNLSGVGDHKGKNCDKIMVHWMTLEYLVLFGLQNVGGKYVEMDIWTCFWEKLDCLGTFLYRKGVRDENQALGISLLW